MLKTHSSVLGHITLYNLFYYPFISNSNRLPSLMQFYILVVNNYENTGFPIFQIFRF